MIMNKILFLILTLTITLTLSAQVNNDHEYVDLGLSVKWATCNIGADTPTDFGDYYAWGDLKTKQLYTGKGYTYKSNPSVLPLNRDVAHVKWGGAWRMPTLEEWEELADKSKCTWTERMDGEKLLGYEVKGPNGNKIFLPAAGLLYGNTAFGDNANGSYWSATLHKGKPANADCLGFDQYNHGTNDYERFYGRSVRAVCPK